MQSLFAVKVQERVLGARACVLHVSHFLLKHAFWVPSHHVETAYRIESKYAHASCTLMRDRAVLSSNFH